jgi:hypothetical protein
MDDRPPFDTVKASFYLIAAVLGVQCLVVLASVIGCMVYMDTIMKNPDIVCDPKDRLSQLLTGALAAALAFAGGFTRDKK